MIDIPEWQYWLSGTPLYLATSSAFAVVVSVAGLRDKISSKALMCCLSVAVVFSLFAWLAAAKQERDGALLKSSLDRIADNLKINSNASARSLADEILKRLPAKFPLTDSERERLTLVLNEVPTEQRFPVEVYWPQLNGTHGYADTIAKVFTDNHWQATVKMAGLINGHGLTFAVSRKVAEHAAPLPEGAIRLMGILMRAQIPFAMGGVDNTTDDIFAFVVGQPQTPQ
jgi:hypothetical protein